MWYCGKCGRENFQNSNFCQACGSPRAPQKKRQLFDLKESIIVLCLIIIIAVLSLLIVNIYVRDSEPFFSRQKKDYSQIAEEQYQLFLDEHPQYISKVSFDINQDGIEEMLVSEQDRFPTKALLLVLSSDGKRLLSWDLYSRFSDYLYDSQSKRLITSSSGTGLNEFCVMTLSGDSLLVRHIGKNLFWPDMDDYYYDFSETLVGGDNTKVSYNYGWNETSGGALIPNMDILEGYAISKDEYQRWYDYFQSLHSLKFES